jgi:hypothetical protein
VKPAWMTPGPRVKARASMHFNKNGTWCDLVADERAPVSLVAMREVRCQIASPDTSALRWASVQ